ncbi:flagellar assembly protein FliH [Massilia sp. GCM10023247]|uniref:flagellar assembly protein FliH n=1 Tax=Massilia sp. GCM10023247 TaxID=3252643 RepID=UPI0036188408
MSKDMQGAFKRWEMTSFGDERPSSLAARIQAEERAAAAASAAAAAAAAGSSRQPAIQLPTAAELEAIREAARAEGHAEGYAEGLLEGRTTGHSEAFAAGQQETADEMAALRAVATTFSQAVAAADETIASDVLDLALHLARSMVRSAFEVRPELIIPIVREAIDYLPVLQAPAVLALNPEDVEIVRAALSDELDKGGWRVVADPQIGRGGCKVDTASNQIDAQAAARWARLSHALGKNVEWLA